MLILDSDTISYYFRGDPHVVPRLQALRPADLGVPAVVEHELRYGLLRLPHDAATPSSGGVGAIAAAHATLAI